MTSRVEIVVPGTGELVDLRVIPTDQLVEIRARLADISGHVAAVRGPVNDELRRRIDDENAKSGEGYTWRVNGFKISVPSPTAKGVLRNEPFREELIRDHHGNLDIDKLFRRTITYELIASRWDSLIKDRPELDEIRQRHTAPNRRDVKFTPLPAMRALEATAEDDT